MGIEGLTAGQGRTSARSEPAMNIVLHAERQRRGSLVRKR
jgi:hypothetical protein